ncbi:hypothetical protein CROQUDRAFT_93090 [Cronartium quercuum f. sp. fusiforme G11]|uniref:Uncharacterized protein n=1 Tax=Cronartium quercuum f. sp. fusiforme G11 TaxID=708437 RepID=A0A9P6NFQ5_9BASI|nr:hypothetical protein CROQUDRAFT_93090 [Cronartium quercuum f. sp. fusiforme G11]
MRTLLEDWQKVASTLTLPETLRGLANPLQEHHPAPKKVRPALPIWRGRTGSTQLGKERDGLPLLSPMGLVLSSLFSLSAGYLRVISSLSRSFVSCFFRHRPSCTASSPTPIACLRANAPCEALL